MLSVLAVIFTLNFCPLVVNESVSLLPVPVKLATLCQVASVLAGVVGAVVGVVLVLVLRSGSSNPPIPATMIRPTQQIPITLNALTRLDCSLHQPVGPPLDGLAAGFGVAETPFKSAPQFLQKEELSGFSFPHSGHFLVIVLYLPLNNSFLDD